MRYKIYYQENNKVKKITLSANSKEQLKKLSNYPTNIISIKEQFTLKKEISLFHNNKKEVYELFSQLDIMLSAHLSFSESVDLLLQSKHEKKINEILLIIQKSLSSSIPIEKALASHKKYLGDTSLLFLKLGFENGNIKESIHSLVEILHEDKKSYGKLKEVMRYPLILLISLCVAITMIFVYVLPNFDFIFTLLKDNIPFSTQILINVKEILNQYGIVLLSLLIAFIISVKIMMKKYKLFFDKFIILRIPIVSRMIRDYYLYRVFLSISVIVKSKYQFQVALLNSKNIVNNYYVQNVIDSILTSIKNGSSLSQGFAKSKLFDNLTIKLLHTADHTNQYEFILSDITEQYKKRFHKSIKNFSSSIEPMLILVIALIVLWLVLAIMLPIWNLSSIIN